MLDKRCPHWLGVAFLAGLVALPHVAGANDRPLPARLQNLVLREMDAAVARTAACPATPAMTAIAAAQGDFAVALASAAADVLARSREQPAADPCACLQSAAAASIRAQPAQAAPVHRALRARFPQCSEAVLRAVQGTLGTLSVSGTARRETVDEQQFAALSPVACQQPAVCVSIEPGPADVASKTHRRY